MQGLEVQHVVHEDRHDVVPRDVSVPPLILQVCGGQEQVVDALAHELGAESEAAGGVAVVLVVGLGRGVLEAAEGVPEEGEAEAGDEGRVLDAALREEAS